VGAVAIEAAPRFQQVPRSVEPWEVHSELVLVSREVYERALELLPERDPDAFLARPPVTAFAAVEAERGASLPVAVFGYALWRLAETGRSALWTVGVVIGLALLAQVVH
jgi:hypothetical protein